MPGLRTAPPRRVLGRVHTERALIAAIATTAMLLSGCSGTTDPAVSPGPPASASGQVSPPLESPAPPPSEPAVAPTPEPMPTPTAEVDQAALRAVVDTLAGELGPREATSQAYDQAADLVDATFRDLGYEVRRLPVSVPAGNSWGVPVPAGQSSSVVAVAPGADLAEPHLVVGAHLDTVPQAPGAVDNASGIAVVLEVARLATIEAPPQPVAFVAFAAEEPRGPGDDLHHFGSQAYVATMPTEQRESIIGAIAIDSVGISDDGVPICSARGPDDPFVDRVRTAVRTADVALRACENRTSDHWSFVRNGLDGVRIGLAGDAEYAEYHSSADVADIVRDDLVAQAAEAVWAAISWTW